MTGTRRLRLAVGVVVLAAATTQLVVARARPAAATGPTLAQTGAVVTGSGTTLTLTLPSGSTAGNLLIAVFEGFGSNSSTNAPGGWQNADEGSGNAQSRRSTIWYYQNNPGGISSVNFTLGSGTTWSAGQMMEWSGMDTLAPLDVFGRGSSTSSLTDSVSGGDSNNDHTAYANEIAVTIFQEELTSASTVTMTPGAGWTNLGNTSATSATTQYTSDYKTGIASNNGTSETETSYVSSSAVGWEGIMATFAPAPTCSGGSLTLGVPSLNFNVSNTGLDKTTNSNKSLTPDDETASNAGWNIQLTSTQFTTGAHTLSTTATSVTAASRSATAGTCTLPTNSITYPITVPAGAGPPAAVKVYNAAANTGEGQSTVQLTFKVATLASTYAGSYTSTWTFTIASGP